MQTPRIAGGSGVGMGGLGVGGREVGMGACANKNLDSKLDLNDTHLKNSDFSDPLPPLNYPSDNLSDSTHRS